MTDDFRPFDDDPQYNFLLPPDDNIQQQPVDVSRFDHSSYLELFENSTMVTNSVAEIAADSQIPDGDLIIPINEDHVPVILDPNSIVDDGNDPAGVAVDIVTPRFAKDPETAPPAERRQRFKYAGLRMLAGSHLFSVDGKPIDGING
jgi:hypothetical protein